MFNGFDISSIGKYDKHDKLYFYITVRTRENKMLWGRITDGNLVLSAYGKIAEKELDFFDSVHNSIYVEECVVMPNHIHIMLAIEKSGFEFMPSESELKSFIYNIVEQYKQSTTDSILAFVNDKMTMGVPEETDADFWHDSCNIKTIGSLNEYGKATHHIKNNLFTWSTDKYYPLEEFKENL